MRPQPVIEKTQPRNSGKLEGDVAIITGGDSGIGQAVAVGFANEGASTGEAFARQYV